MFGSGSSMHVNYQVAKIHQLQLPLDKMSYLKKQHLEYAYFDGYMGYFISSTPLPQQIQLTTPSGEAPMTGHLGLITNPLSDNSKSS